MGGAVATVRALKSRGGEEDDGFGYDEYVNTLGGGQQSGSSAHLPPHSQAHLQAGSSSSSSFRREVPSQELVGLVFDLDDRAAKRVLLQVLNAGCVDMAAVAEAVASTQRAVSARRLPEVAPEPAKAQPRVSAFTKGKEKKDEAAESASSRGKRPAWNGDFASSEYEERQAELERLHAEQQAELDRQIQQQMAVKKTGKPPVSGSTPSKSTSSSQPQQQQQQQKAAPSAAAASSSSSSSSAQSQSQNQQQQKPPRAASGSQAVGRVTPQAEERPRPLSPPIRPAASKPATSSVTNFDDIPIKTGGGGGGMGMGMGTGMGMGMGAPPPARPASQTSFNNNPFGPGAAAPVDSGPIGPLAECGVCGRTFAQDRLAKHEKACQKTSKPRKQFDVTKHRVEGTELAAYVIGPKAKQRSKTPPKKKNNWRHQHEEFIANIRAAREFSEAVKAGKDVRDLPPPPPSKPNPDLVPCPHCARSFNEAAAERHIPKCKTMINKPKPPPGRSAPAPMIPMKSARK